MLVVLPMLIVQVTVSVSPLLTVTPANVFLANIPSVPDLVSLNNPASVTTTVAVGENDFVIVATEAPPAPVPDAVALAIVAEPSALSKPLAAVFSVTRSKITGVSLPVP